MSIPPPEGASRFSGEELPHTALIARLAGEFFSGRQIPLGSSATIPSSQPLTPPTALAGAPADAPTEPRREPPDAAADHGLSGGFPDASTIHPTPHQTKPSVGPSQPAPEGNDVDTEESYPFGTPFFGVGVFRSFEERPSAPSSTSGQFASEPQFYFLKEHDRAAEASPQRGLHSAPPPALSVFDIEAIRRDFPALQQKVNGHPLIWLDNAATTQKPRRVIDATSRYYTRDNSNIHRAAHTLSERSTALFEASREKVRQFLGAGDAKEIVFVRGTTEAINLVAQTYGRKNIGQGDEIILTELEHHANIVPWQLLAEQVGATIRVVPINDRGELVLDEFVKLLGPRTKFVSVAHVSNSLGTVNPVEEIIPLAHARGVPVLVDGAQSTPHLPVNVSALDVDFYVFSAHKIFGPTGVGALYGKLPLLEAMPPYQGGGHMIRDVTFEKTIHQQAPEKFEAGTPDIVGVVGLGAAIDYLTTLGLPAVAAYEHRLLDHATQALATVPGLRPIGVAANKASVVAFVIPGIPNEIIADHLDKHGIAVRAGHHCALPAIRHFGLETTVRPSLAFYNTREEVDTLVAVLQRLPRK